MSVTPTLALDVLHEDEARTRGFVYGVAFGIGF
jgi:hypothetical protein